MHNLQRNLEFHLCLGPGCGSGQYHDDSGSEEQPNNCNPAQMICSACNFATCVSHGIPWHTGKTCTQYDEENQEVLRKARKGATAERQRINAEKAKERAIKRAETKRQKEA